MDSTTSTPNIQHIRYRRFTALWKGTLCLLFIILCILLLWFIYDGLSGKLETLYYSIAAVLGIWFIGPLCLMFGARFIKKPPVLLSWNDEAILCGKRNIRWEQIRKIELSSYHFSKWILSSSPMIVLFLNDGTRHHIATDHLLSKKERDKAINLLQQTLRDKHPREDEYMSSL
ncbi:hypothetical protein MH215_11550 [Paenibacillus sp. ACRSA]|uniref:hypothetical protein n=1 Tax=Paenibacillus sp. ACRSA TaxID=2918211 RepID=UPI001EF6647C|nr:hypothetical protein [Paenibacillus sp. ACRSA]MCG7377628.1 hypothetical protein [Paenibacillus sp. ACRSA]